MATLHVVYIQLNDFNLLIFEVFINHYRMLMSYIRMDIGLLKSVIDYFTFSCTNRIHKQWNFRSLKNKKKVYTFSFSRPTSVR